MALSSPRSCSVQDLSPELDRLGRISLIDQGGLLLHKKERKEGRKKERKKREPVGGRYGRGLWVF